MKQKSINLSNFYADFHAKTEKFLGWTLSNQLWLLRDLAYEEFSEKTWDVFRDLQKFVDTQASKSGQRVSFSVDVFENRVVLDPAEWMVNSISLGKLQKEQECGYSDLDANFETQQICGMQLEEFHRGTWAKDRVLDLFKEELFEALEPLEFDAKKSKLPKVLFEMNSDLKMSLNSGVQHPFSLRACVCELNLIVEKNGEKTIYPLMRTFKHTDIPRVINDLKDDIKEHYKSLTKAIVDEQNHLRALPAGWPNEEVYALSQQWAQRRFLGDNGLVGSDFFDGEWFSKSGPTEIVGNKKLALVNDEISGDGLSFAQLRLLRQKKQQAQGESLGQNSDCNDEGQKVDLSKFRI